MAPRSIALTEEQDRIVDDLLESGRFRDVQEVVREALRRVAEGDEPDDRDTTLDELRADIQVGLDDIAAGRYIEFGDEASLRAHFEALALKGLSPQAEHDA